VRALIREARPDVAHLHNVAHQLTPSILAPLREAGIPVVQTLHDYKLICSSYLLFADGEVCERCASGNHLEAVRRRCHHGSMAKSLLGAAEMTWHARRGSYDPVDRFLCPSQFMKAKCAAFGVAPERLEHLPYFLDVERYRPDPTPGDYVLYVGRLSREKGVSTLLRAAGCRSGRPLVVLGEGPLRDALEADAVNAGVDARFEGYLTGEALHDRIRGAAFVVVPSEWYENLPYAILESFALGKPVLGASMGGIPELVRDGETGRLFPAGDAEALAAAWETLESDPATLRRMGERARARIETEFDRDTHLTHLVDLYRRLAS
jgi:glycosyltransferase involved in cell wall biosynthesis